MSRRLTRQCSICLAPERHRIELCLVGGASARATAQRFGVSPHACLRHLRHHVTPERRAALLLGPVQIEALAAKVAEESESVIDHHRAVRAGLYELYTACLSAGDATTGAMVAGRLTDVNRAISALTGELAQSPLIQTNTVNVFTDASFLRFQDDLIRVLNRYPDAREAVLAEFSRLERQAEPALPALEHHADAA